MVPRSPHGGRTGGREKLQELFRHQQRLPLPLKTIGSAYVSKMRLYGTISRARGMYIEVGLALVRGFTAGVYPDRGAIVPASICHIAAWCWNGSVNIDRSAVVNMDCVTEEMRESKSSRRSMSSSANTSSNNRIGQSPVRCLSHSISASFIASIAVRFWPREPYNRRSMPLERGRKSSR